MYKFSFYYGKFKNLFLFTKKIYKGLINKRLREKENQGKF